MMSHCTSSKLARQGDPPRLAIKAQGGMIAKPRITEALAIPVLGIRNMPAEDHEAGLTSGMIRGGPQKED
jgi:hypothetical protein